MFKIKFLVTAFLLLGLILVYPPNVLASSLYLSPAGGNIGLGATLAVQVRLAAGGDNVNGVSAFLSYPTDKLDVAYITYGGAFSIAAEGSSGGGSIRISRGNIGGVGGDVNVATIGFRGKSLGAATVSFVGGSAAPKTADSSDSLNLGASKGGNYTVVAATAKSSAAPQVTGSKITDLVVSKVATNSATITWKTDKKGNSLVEYGLEKDLYFLQSVKNESVTDHTITLQGISLSPGTKIHFQAKSKDSTGSETASPDTTIQLKGYKLKIHLINSNNNPLIDTNLLIYSDPLSATTDANGDAQFDDLTSGKHALVAKTALGDRSAEVEVADNHDFEKVQTLDVKIDSNPQLGPGKKTTIFGIDVVYLAIAALLVVGLIVVVVIIIKKKNSQPPLGPDPLGPPTQSPPSSQSPLPPPFPPQQS